MSEWDEISDEQWEYLKNTGQVEINREYADTPVVVDRVEVVMELVEMTLVQKLAKAKTDLFELDSKIEQIRADLEAGGWTDHKLHKRFQKLIRQDWNEKKAVINKLSREVLESI